MAQNTNIINLVGQVGNPASTSQSDGNTPPISAGRQAELLTAEIHGKYYTAAYRKNVFKFNVTAVTVPVVASGLVSVFTLWNPPSSGVVGEIVETMVGQVLATTVVDTIGWYFSSGNLALAGTFTTKSVALTNHFSARVGDTPANTILPYTAYTHSGTPVRCDIIGSFGAVTDAAFTLPVKAHDGKLLIPPGTAMSIAMSTAAGDAAGLDLQVDWAEWPF